MPKSERHGHLTCCHQPGPCKSLTVVVSHDIHIRTSQEKHTYSFNRKVVELIIIPLTSDGAIYKGETCAIVNIYHRESTLVAKRVDLAKPDLASEDNS